MVSLGNVIARPDWRARWELLGHGVVGVVKSSRRILMPLLDSLAHLLDSSVMPLFLCNLAPLVGKNEDTLARWCERGGVIPGAYRTRGGNQRRGKWRVAVPRVHPDDLATARNRSRRDGIAFGEYVALLTLDRLCNRIVANAQKFARGHKKSLKEAHDKWIKEEASAYVAECEAKGVRVTAVPGRQILANIASLEAEAAANYWNSGPISFAELMRRNATPSNDDWRRLIVSVAYQAHAGTRPADVLTLGGMAKALGIPGTEMAPGAEMRKIVEESLHEAARLNGRERGEVMPDVGGGDSGFMGGRSCEAEVVFALSRYADGAHWSDVAVVLGELVTIYGEAAVDDSIEAAVEQSAQFRDCFNGARQQQVSCRFLKIAAAAAR